MIESGSCCALLALEIAQTRKDVTLITNSAFIADYVRKMPTIRIILLGGEYQKESQDQTKTILLSTASPYKFPESVYQAITDQTLDEYSAIDALNETTQVDIPYPLQGMKDRKVLHTKVIDKDSIIDFIGEQVKGL